MDEHELNTMGLRLIAGRNFRAEEILQPFSPAHPDAFVPQIILTKKAAESVFPKQNALGKTVYDGEGRPATVIGIVEDMLGTWPNTPQAPQSVAFFPRLPLITASTTWCAPGQGSAMRSCAQWKRTWRPPNPDRVIRSVKPLSSIKRIVYLGDRNMAIFLATVTVLLVAITSLGIFGLATFNVSTRTKQIGTRRAVGARRGDIIRYFMVENGLITTAGVVVGCALALGRRLLALAAVQPAAPRSVLPGRRDPRAVDPRAARRLAAGAAGRASFPIGGHPYRLTAGTVDCDACLATTRCKPLWRTGPYSSSTTTRPSARPSRCCCRCTARASCRRLARRGAAAALDQETWTWSSRT